MSDIKDLQAKVIKFRDERDWKQFHDLKSLALGLLVEAGELAEHFLYLQGEELKRKVEKNKEDISDELSDVLWWVLLTANELEIDIEKAFDKKLIKTAQKYPVEKVKGKPNKYTDYE